MSLYQANTTVSDERLEEIRRAPYAAGNAETVAIVNELLSARRATADVTEDDSLRSALDRQCDNMAFVINHVGLPDAWLTKFMRELDEDRAALSHQAP